MDVAVVKVLVGLVGISAICTVLVQLGKNIIRSETDAEGNEVRLRRFLAPAVIAAGVLLGLLVGFVRKDYVPEDGLMLMTAWGMAGFLIGAASVGFYGGLKGIFPGVFSGNGWIGSGGQ